VTADSLEISYERLVLALGSVPRTLPIPGLAQHGLGFKDLADAIHLRNHVLRRLEAAAMDETNAARQLTFVFVGAGYAGVEALAELADLVADAVRHYPELRGREQRWVLVDAAPKILPEIPSRLGEYAARQLTKRGIEIHVGTTLESVDDEAAVLSDGSRIPTATLVWTAGVPNAATPGAADPPTSQHALRQARRLAKNLTEPPRPYRYRSLGQVATLGRYKGIAAVLGLRLTGFLGWFVTRSYHLYQLPLLSRKLRVVTDWTVSLLFRRDIAELGMLGHPRGLGDA
jgi:NADH dehydrogenase